MGAITQNESPEEEEKDDDDDDEDEDCRIDLPGTLSPPRANDPRGKFSVIWDKTQRSSYCNSYT